MPTDPQLLAKALRMRAIIRQRGNFERPDFHVPEKQKRIARAENAAWNQPDQYHYAKDLRRTLKLKFDDE